MRTQSLITPVFTGEKLTFINESGQTIELANAPQGYSVRDRVIPSSITDFQLHRDKSVITIEKPLRVTEAGALEPGVSSTISGNSRLALLEKIFQYNKDGSNFQVQPFTIEYLTAEEVADKATVISLAIADNASRPMSEADKLTAIVNLFDGYILQGMSDKEAKVSIGEKLNLSLIQVGAYIDSAIAVERFPFLFKAMDQQILDISTLKYLVKKFDDLDNDDLELSELFVPIVNLAKRDLAEKTKGDLNKKTLDVKVSRTNIDEVFSDALDDLGLSNEGEQSPVEKQETANKAQAKADKELIKQEKTRIKTLSTMQCAIELTQLRSTLLESFTAMGGIIDVDWESLTDTFLNVEDYSKSNAQKLLLRATELNVKLMSIGEQISGLIFETTKSVQSVPTKAENKAKRLDTIESDMEEAAEGEAIEGDGTSEALEEIEELQPV